MKILYLNGPYRKLSYSRCSRSPAVTKSGTIYYPIWLAYAAGLAKQQGNWQVDLIDAVARKWNRAELIKYLNNDPPDMVFCDTSTPSIYEDLATAAAIKDAFSHCRVVMVGTHASALPEEVLACDKRIDAVARGEYDITAIELTRALAQDKPWDQIPGLTLRRGDKFLHTPKRDLITDLDSLPFAGEIYKEFLNIENYFFAAARFPMVMIITSRGCPHRCRWCLYPQVMHRGKYRLRSSANVAEEFAYIARELPDVREVGIEDDLFTGDKKRLHEICELLIKQNNRLNFWCDTRTDLDYETMRLMKAAGCRMLIAGFENADQAILDQIKKGTQSQQAYKFMADARRANLLVHGCFVLGNPGENHDTMNATLDLAKKLDPDTAQFFPMIVYPGTSMYKWAQENNYLKTTNYNDWLTPDGMHNCVTDLPQLTANQVLQFCDHARRAFYLRRGYIFKKMMQSLIKPSEAKRNVKAFRRFAQHLVNSA